MIFDGSHFTFELYHLVCIPYFYKCDLSNFPQLKMSVTTLGFWVTSLKIWRSIPRRVRRRPDLLTHRYQFHKMVYKCKIKRITFSVVKDISEPMWCFRNSLCSLQVFSSPWAESKELEERHAQLTKEISSWPVNPKDPAKHVDKVQVRDIPIFEIGGIYNL